MLDPYVCVHKYSAQSVFVLMQTASKNLGLKVAAACKEKNISTVAFDRAGYKFHGRVAAVAEGAREGGLDF